MKDEPPQFRWPHFRSVTHATLKRPVELDAAFWDVVKLLLVRGGVESDNINGIGRCLRYVRAVDCGPGQRQPKIEGLVVSGVWLSDLTAAGPQQCGSLK